MAASFKKLSTARRSVGAQDAPVVRVGDLYIAGVDSLTSVALISPDGPITGEITLRHLDRLGNGNHAIEAPQAPTRRYTFERTVSHIAASHPREVVSLAPGSDAAREPRLREMFAALKVVALDAKIRAFLAANDPQALLQVEAALRAASELGFPKPEQETANAR